MGSRLPRRLSSAAIFSVAALVALSASAAPLRLSVGLQLPATGIDAGEGLRMRDAAQTAAADLRRLGIDVQLVDAVGANPVQNPHQDEGSDNDADVEAGPQEVRALRAAGIRVLVGPLRANVALAESATLSQVGSVALSGTAGAPAKAGTHVFKLAPSDRQLAVAAYAWMRRHLGSRACVLDDGSARGRQEAAAFLAADPEALSAGARAPAQALRQCVTHSDAVYATGLFADPILCSAATANRAGPLQLATALGLRGFDPAAFRVDGALWRAEPAPIPRTPALLQAARRYHARAFVAADDSALRYYASVQIAAAVLLDPVGNRGAQHALQTRTFETILGRIHFTDRGEIANPSIRIRRLN